MNTNQNVSDQTLQWIRTCVPIPSIIAGTTLKPSGEQLVARCPLPDHEDRHPSFYVSVAKRRFYCHGCKRGGDVIELYRQLHAVTFRKAVTELLERSGTPPAENGNQRPGRTRLKAPPGLVTTDRHREVLRRVQVLYQEQAESSSDFAEYLGGRGFELAHCPGLGWAPRSGLGLQDRFIEEEQQTLIELGLLDRRGDQAFERLRGAITFPATHFAGATVGFIGRRINGQPKYLNTAFPKRVFPLGLAEARDATISSHEVTLVEGPFDWLALRAAGISNVLALLGGEISDSAVNLLRVMGVTSTNLMFDGDEAGQNAATVAESRLRSAGIRARMIGLPVGGDPADLWKEPGGRAIHRLLATVNSSSKPAPTANNVRRSSTP